MTSTPVSWRRLPLVTGLAGDLLAAGAELLDTLATDPVPVVRWYRSTDAVIVVGRGQQSAAFDATELPVVGRFSGGGAVLMDAGLLSLDVVVPSGHPLLDGDLPAIFDRVGDAWATALRTLGVPDVNVHQGPSTTPRRGSQRERLIAAICYATLGRGEVTSAGRKVVGLAQRRRRHGAMVQCGLLRHWDPAPLLRALGADTADEQIVTAAAGLDDFLDHAPSDAQVMAAVEQALIG